VSPAHGFVTGISRDGGRAPKWDRLHEREMAEVKAAVERVCGREVRALEMAPLLEVLARWAGHRYKVCRNAVWQDKKQKLGGAKVTAGKVMTAAPEAKTVQQETQGDGLPW
jgi:hypothetical protein